MSEPVRVAVLWTCLSGYLNACLKDLAARENVELFVCHSNPSVNAPFDSAQFEWMRRRIAWSVRPDEQALIAQLEAFKPDVLVLCGWHIPAYRKAARKLRNRAWRVMTMDNCWSAKPKQMLGILVGPLILPSLADAAWVPGERQVSYAQMLGFPQHKILRGLYSCDTASLSGIHREQKSDGRDAFIFIGRFVAEKGIAALLDAYARYRERVSDPWPLDCYGSGPLRAMMEGREGIEVRGFVQPYELNKGLDESTCLVLPSKFEPWGVAVHEATAAGLLVIASGKVGATVHLVQPGSNGFIFDSGDVEACAAAMQRVHGLSKARRAEMSAMSRTLSSLYSPQRWSQTLLESFAAAQQTSEKPAP